MHLFTSIMVFAILLLLINQIPNDRQNIVFLNSINYRLSVFFFLPRIFLRSNKFGLDRKLFTLFVFPNYKSKALKNIEKW